MSFETIDDAQAFVAAVLDSTIQPNRLEILNRAALEAHGTPAGAGVAVSVASVEAAVIAQEEHVRTLARSVNGRARPAPVEWWDRYGSVAAQASIALRIGTLTSAVAETVRVTERLFGGPTPIVGTAATGTLLVLMPAPQSSRALDQLRDCVAGLRATVGPHGGHVVITRAPRAIREAIDPWGPVDAGALALMRGLKDEFDPHRVLNPGRFVGGL